MTKTRDSGQSLIEALLGFSLFSTLAVVLHATALWHDYSLQSLHASAKAGFLSALGKRAPGDGSALDARAGNLLFDRSDLELMRDWQIGEAGLLVGTHYHEGVVLGASAPGWVPAPRIERRTYLHGGAGHGASDAQAQARVGLSGMAWSAAADRSVDLVRQSRVRLQRIDASWHRPAPDTDWLGRWTGYVPAGLLRRVDR